MWTRPANRMCIWFHGRIQTQCHLDVRLAGTSLSEMHCILHVALVLQRQNDHMGDWQAIRKNSWSSSATNGLETVESGRQQGQLAATQRQAMCSMGMARRPQALFLPASWCQAPVSLAAAPGAAAASQSWPSALKRYPPATGPGWTARRCAPGAPQDVAAIETGRASAHITTAPLELPSISQLLCC